MICKVEQISTNQKTTGTQVNIYISEVSVCPRDFERPWIQIMCCGQTIWSHEEKYSNGILKQMSFSDVIAFPFSYFKKLNFFLLL